MSKKEKQFNNPTLFKYILRQIKSSWIIWALFLCCIVTSYIVARYKLSEEPWGVVLSNISFGYIAGMIFYVFSDLAPTSKRKIKEYNQLLYLVDCRLKFEMESCLNSDIWEYRKDEEKFSMALLQSLCIEDVSQFSSFSNVTISKDQLNIFLNDLDKAVLSANIIIKGFARNLTPQWSIIIYSISILKGSLKVLHPRGGNKIQRTQTPHLSTFC